MLNKKRKELRLKANEVDGGPDLDNFLSSLNREEIEFVIDYWENQLKINATSVMIKPTLINRDPEKMLALINTAFFPKKT
jgi:capsule polysaccharide export protein KpsE/RkpR